MKIPDYDRLEREMKEREEWAKATFGLKSNEDIGVKFTEGEEFMNVEVTFPGKMGDFVRELIGEGGFYYSGEHLMMAQMIDYAYYLKEVIGVDIDVPRLLFDKDYREDIYSE